MDIKVDKSTVIVFDLDDTLYNELDYLKSAYLEIAMSLEPKNWKPLYVKMFSLYRSGKNVFDFLSTRYNIKIKVLVEMYRAHRPTIDLFDGILKMLQDIKSKQGKLGIITDGRSVTQRAKLENLGILELVDKVIISEEIGSEKPNLENFIVIENALPAKTYYYIADNLKKDFIAPNALGWKSLGLIDNGKNIHFEYDDTNLENTLPQDFFFNYKELKIV